MEIRPPDFRILKIHHRKRAQRPANLAVYRLVSPLDTVMSRTASARSTRVPGIPAPEVFSVGLPNLTNCRLPVSSLYRTIPECSVRYRGVTKPLGWGSVNTPGMSSRHCWVLQYQVTSVELVPNLPQSDEAPAWRSYRAHQNIGYWYRVSTEPYRSIRQGIEAVPSLTENLG